MIELGSSLWMQGRIRPTDSLNVAPLVNTFITMPWDYQIPSLPLPGGMCHVH